MQILLIGNKGRIDFKRPFSMNPEQKKEFFSLLKELFDVVEEPEEVSYLRQDRLGSKEIHAPWNEAREYIPLLKIEDPRIVAQKLGRTPMSIVMRLGNVIPRLLLWCDEKGRSMETLTLEDIETFLREREAKKLERKEKRKLRTKIIHRIEEMLDDEIEPCMVEDPVFYGGECKDGFHSGCITCPRSKGFIKTKEDIDLFNDVYKTEFDEE